ncbi:PaaI family thioesterase [Streptomyces lomondensis]|uniref:Aromatic compound degradation protein PaaI n=1 Tax=Streptomyces lomondensis TaxID=68229 RepID=A0ABQ2X833_9ACTN|nr:PaaI family thioesterase [Streptomyces lomondensis]MCF0081395.1 PaaI family thioesterase [Streptomyces lomondensis]GGX03355.1 aromatic compound degradation protein PaaI [Streptomyces lomondensis]
MLTRETEDVYALAPYAKTLGVVFEEMTKAGVRGRLAHDLSLSTVGGGLHGGALMGLADVCAAVCAALNGPVGAAPATVESSTHFLRPARTGVVATARPLRLGRNNVIEVDVHDDQGELCVRVTQVVTTIKPKES